MKSLQHAASAGDWEDVNRRLNDAFFRYLITDLESLRDVFAAAPEEWYETYPRHIMSRAIVEALGTPGMVLDENLIAAYSDWVMAQETPEMRDVLGLRQARLRVLLKHAWYQDASDEVDATLEFVRIAPPQTDGLQDIMPSVLLRCGTAKLLASDFDAASTCFAEAIRWSESRGHPLGLFANEHLALVHALNERFEQAQALFHGAPSRSEPETLQHQLEAAGLVARLLVAVGTLRLADADALLEHMDDAIRLGDFGWIVLHAEARLALAKSDPWALAHRISHHLEGDVLRAGPTTVAGSTLRADLASLYQAGGDLRAAERVLRSPELSRHQPSIIIARARQALLLGRPEQAMSLLQSDDTSHSFALATRFRASGAVLYASAELALSGKADTSAITIAASTITYNGARWSLMGASAQLRSHLLPLVDQGNSTIPEPWVYRARTKLTRREQEVLRALRTHRTINEVAVSLHVSPNTAKTHVRALYRKLEVHTREDALWIGLEEDRRR